MASAARLSLFKSVGFIQPFVVGPSGASLQTWHVSICGRWPASRRPCAKLTNTTILSYRWFCITGLWNHDPGIPPFFVLWFWFTGFWLFYRGQKQTADDWINDWNTNKNYYFQFTFHLNDLYTSTHMTELSNKKRFNHKMNTNLVQLL